MSLPELDKGIIFSSIQINDFIQIYSLNICIFKEIILLDLIGKKNCHLQKSNTI